MTLNPTSILRGTILGRLSRAEIDQVVEHYWSSGRFVHHVSAAAIPEFARVEGGARRYGLCARLDARLMYGSLGHPGCLLVTTPTRGPYDREFERFVVAPHRHDSSHITAVTAGRAVFLIVREDGPQPALITAAVGPGSVVLYPAGAVHTFVSDEQFQVASLQASYQEPEGRAFADTAVARLATLPRVSYEAYRRRIDKPTLP